MGWGVFVSWRIARKEQHGSFQTEREAKKWGQSYAPKWLNRRNSSMATAHRNLNVILIKHCPFTTIKWIDPQGDSPGSQ